MGGGGRRRGWWWWWAASQGGGVGVELGVVVMASSPWQLTNVYKALRNFLISAGLLEPRRTALIPNKHWVSSEWLAGAGAPLPFSSAPPLHFWGVEGSCFFFLNPPHPPHSQSHSFLVPALFPLVAPLSVSGKKESLCVAPFLAPPLLCSAHCHQVES